MKNFSLYNSQLVEYLNKHHDNILVDNCIILILSKCQKYKKAGNNN